MIPKYKVWDKKRAEMIDLIAINFHKYIPMDDLTCSCSDGPITRNFQDVVLMQSTGVYDKHDVEIFEGDVVQQVHAYEYSGLEIETPHLEPFEVKECNYVHGKWIAEEVNGDNYSVVRYVFGRDIKVIGNIYENSELLEVV